MTTQMGHTFQYKLYRPCLKERDRFNDSNSCIKLFGKSCRDRFMRWIPCCAKRLRNWNIKHSDAMIARRVLRATTTGSMIDLGFVKGGRVHPCMYVCWKLFAYKMIQTSLKLPPVRS
jgi:hypothetical protein